MEYKTVEYNGVKIHLIKTDKFKTCICSVHFLSEAKKENVTKDALLNELMADSTETYPTYFELRRALADLYASRLSIFNYPIGNRNNFNVIFSFLNPKYTNKEELAKNINFLFDVIYKPNIKDNKFNQNIFDYTVESLINAINSIYENKRKYAIWRTKNILNPNMPGSFLHYGFVEDYKLLNPSNMVDYYHELINREMHVFFAGNVDISEVEKIIKSRLIERKIQKSIPLVPCVQKLNKEVKEVIEKEPNNQSQLVMAYTTNDLSWYESHVVFRLLNLILGGGPNSLLFDEIREKRSLCYSISSTFSRYENYLLVTTSINDKNYDLAVNEIKKVINQVKAGNITQKIIKDFKKQLINYLNNYDDSTLDILDNYVEQVFFEGKESSELIKLVKNITKDDIVKVAQKINLQVIYFLSSGGKNEKI